MAKKKTTRAPRLTDAQLKNIYKLADSGMAGAEIAESMGLKPSRIYRAMSKAPAPRKAAYAQVNEALEASVMAVGHGVDVDRLLREALAAGVQIVIIGGGSSR